MAENELRCNNLRNCRKRLAEEGRAVVTTCSHIFCHECAELLFGPQRDCPACGTHLDEVDDIVSTFLNPPNDYRTSVLSGLAFWLYQTSQEASYQAVLLSKSQEYNVIAKQQLQDAYNEITAHNNRALTLERDLEVERRKNLDLLQSSKDRDKEYNKLKAQYDKIKQRALLNPVASEDILSLPVSEMSLGSSRQTSRHPNDRGVSTFGRSGVATAGTGGPATIHRSHTASHNLQPQSGPWNPTPSPRQGPANPVSLSSSASRPFQPVNTQQQTYPTFGQKTRYIRGSRGSSNRTQLHGGGTGEGAVGLVSGDEDNMFIGANRHLGANDRRKSQVQQRAGFDQGNDVIGPSPGTEWDGMQQSGTAGSTRRNPSQSRRLA